LLFLKFENEALSNCYDFNYKVRENNCNPMAKKIARTNQKRYLEK